jgi:hypothetical protein
MWKAMWLVPICPDPGQGGERAWVESYFVKKEKEKKTFIAPRMTCLEFMSKNY